MTICRFFLFQSPDLRTQSALSDPAKLRTLAERRVKPKALGDGPFKPTTQNVATCGYEHSPEDLATFTALALGYIFEGFDRTTICGLNAEVRRNPSFTANDLANLRFS